MIAQMLAPELVATTAVAVVILARRRPSAMLPGAVAGLLLMVMGFFGSALWNWSRSNNGAGLTATFTADERLTAAGNQAFLWASFGCFVGALLAAALVSEPRVRTDGAIDRWISLVVLVLSVVLIFAWLAGQGPNIMLRAVYLQTNGNDTLLKATSLLGPLVGAGALATSGGHGQPRLLRTIAHAQAAVWFVLLTAVGSRVAVLFPVLAIGLAVSYACGVRGVVSKLVGVVVGFLGLWAAVTAFTVSQEVRSVPHGMDLWLKNWSGPGTPGLFDFSSWLSPVQRLTSSVAASSFITDMSARYPAELAMLIRNANPLPSSLVGTTINPYSAERLWPLDWVPLSFVGEWYGAAGPVAQVCVFGGITLFAGVVSNRFKQVGFAFGQALSIAIPVLVTVISMQYPSRMFWRAVSILLVLPAGLLIPWLLASTGNIFRKKVTHEEPA